ncbi:unnamed protein product [Microthlaspi erraticum]|uniref:Uncharacterized protein n=1 Tax=Microthlaspi erraticum TaxID=1685480 RepID=A0A6D2IJ43_9BRAS|nr:unnamed protein product [Microthlaspi erraticum]
MASLTAAIFFVCKGETKKASEMFQMFIKLSGVSLEDPRAQQFGDEIVRNIFRCEPHIYPGSHLNHFHIPTTTSSSCRSARVNMSSSMNAATATCTALRFACVYSSLSVSGSSSWK